MNKTAAWEAAEFPKPNRYILNLYLETSSYLDYLERFEVVKELSQCEQDAYKQLRNLYKELEKTMFKKP